MEPDTCIIHLLIRKFENPEYFTIDLSLLSFLLFDPSITLLVRFSTVRATFSTTKYFLKVSTHYHISSKFIN